MGNDYNLLISVLLNFWQVTILYSHPVLGVPLLIGMTVSSSLLLIFLFNQACLMLKKVLVKVEDIANHFGEISLRTRSLKESKQLTFGRLIYHQYIEQLFIRQIKQIYYPTGVSFAVSLAVIASLFLLPYPHLNGDELIKYMETNFYQNYIAIHAGIGAIILALLILVAETSNSGKQSDKARLILKETHVFPLVSMEIFSLLFFTTGIRSVGAVLSVWIVGLLTIAAVYRVTKLLISRYVFQQKEQQLVKDRFANSLSKKVSDRIATNTLLSYLKTSEYEIDYKYFRTKKDHIQTFYLSKRGVLTDIKLDNLNRLLEGLELVANQGGNTIRKANDKKRNPGFLNSTTGVQNASDLTTICISLRKLIGEEITGDSSEILEIPKSLVEDIGSQKRLQKVIDSIFILTPEDAADKEIRLELDEAKEKAFTSIVESRLGTLSSVMEVYEILVAQFLDVFQTFGGGYTSESASEERHSFFGGWSYIQWIKEDLVDVFSEAVNSKKEKLVKEITYTPIKILNSAFEKRDHLIFQEFLSFQPYLYFLGQKVEDIELKKFLFDRASKYLKDFCDYRIASELEDYQIEIEEITHVKDFVLEIVQTYNSLLKYALDRKDTINFGSYLSDLHSILHRFKPSEDNLRLLEEMKLKSTNITEVQKKEVENNLARISLLEETEIEIQQNKDELTFGLAAWCLGKLKESNFNEEDLLTIWGKLLPYLPKEFDTLIKMLEKTTDHKVEKNWGWTWWDLEEKRGDKDGVVTGEVTFYGKICNLFALLILKCLNGKSVDDVNLSNLEIQRDLSFYFERDDSFVRSSVIQIGDNQPKWQKVLGEDEAKSKQVALTLLSRLVEKQKLDEAKRLINTNIDSLKVNEFMDNFITAYTKEVSLRKLLDSFDAVKSTTTILKSKKYWGFNEIQDKEPFLKIWHVDYGNHGEHYGRGLAESEDQIIFNKIRTESKSLGRHTLLSESILSGINQLEKSGYKPTVMFTTFHFGEWSRSTLDDESFIPPWNVPNSQFKNWPHFIGLYKFGRRKIPIFRYWLRNSKEIPEVIISDLKNFIKLYQYPPYSSKYEKDTSIQKGNFLFKIIDLSADSGKKIREKLLKRMPLWLEKHSNKVEYLKQKVIVNLKEKFEVVIKEQKASVRITINFPKD